ncbi:hypothetical protein BDQ17DRAFT_1428950 [Cyathus striatus]|nr:hypothetical protein BDQ17DRAFT_1428950 [Cyathus striatus]
MPIHYTVDDDVELQELESNWDIDVGLKDNLDVVKGQYEIILDEEEASEVGGSALQQAINHWIFEMKEYEDLLLGKKDWEWLNHIWNVLDHAIGTWIGLRPGIPGWLIQHFPFPRVKVHGITPSYGASPLQI